MRRTLLLIPHEIGPLPVFGWGWVLIGLALGLVLRLLVARLRGRSVSALLVNEGLVWGIAAAVVVWVLPRVELTNLQQEPVGMAIRGYGVMLLLAVSAAVALAAYRARRRGIDPDIIFSLTPWAFIGGIGGARLFYVIQYRDQFVGDTFAQTLGNMLRFTEGGLVVYGSFIGGGLAVSYYIIRHRLPLLKFGDVIVPCLFLGVFLGRIGCLMNGCCYGGRCDDHWAAIHFPPGSPVYQTQLKSGELLGLTVAPRTGRIVEVAPHSPAAAAGVSAGSRLESVRLLPPQPSASTDVPAEALPHGVLAIVDGQPIQWTPAELPERALPVYAAQLLSSLGALALCLALCGLSLVFNREGAIMMLGFAGYAVLRFLLELVRVDESGQFGTSLTISQWVSVIVFCASLTGLWWVYRRPRQESLIQVPSSTG